VHAGEHPDETEGGRDIIVAARLDEATATSVAATLQALATPSCGQPRTARRSTSTTWSVATRQDEQTTRVNGWPRRPRPASLISVPSCGFGLNSLRQ